MLFLILLSLSVSDPPFDTCTVSWYGEPFHGKITASGTVFNMYEMTVAHCTLPMGSIIEMVNPVTGITIVVRVTDTGPWEYDENGYAIYPLRPHPARKFDLSRKAFDILSGGNLDRGVMVIKYRVIGRDTNGLHYNLRRHL